MLTIKTRFLKESWMWLAVIFETGIIFTIRLTVINNFLAPTGCDPANCLTVLHALNGYNIVGYPIEVLYPPLYFYLILQPLVSIFGELQALKVSAALLFSIITIPFFALVKKIISNDFIALLTSGLFSFAEGYSAMICWGGQPNMLAIFFMLTSIYFFYKMVENNSRRDSIIAGVFLSLTAGSHQLTLPIYVFTLIFSIPIIYMIKRQCFFPFLKNFLILVIVGALLSIPYLATYSYYINSFYNSLTPKISTTFDLAPLIFGFEYIFQNKPAWTIVIILSVVCPILDFKNNELAVVLIVSLSLSILVHAFLLLPGGIPTRPLFFIYIPIFLAFSIFLSLVNKFIKNEHRKPTYYKRLLVVVSLALIFMVSISLVTTSYTRFEKGTKYYNVADGEVIQALTWLRENTPPNAIILANDLFHSWWIEGYALRKAYMPGSSAFYVAQQREFDVANKIISGNYVLDNLYLRVSDNFPAAFYNPLISVNTGRVYQKLLYFNDNRARLVVSANNSVSECSLYRLEKSNKVDVVVDNDLGSITYSYFWDLTVINRTLKLYSKPQTIVTYDITLTNCTMKSFEIIINIHPDSRINTSSIGNGTVLLSLSDPHGRVINVMINILTNGKIIDIGKAISFGKFIIYFVFNTTNTHLHTEFRILVEPKVQPVYNNVQFFNSLELIKTYGINYLFINKKFVVDVNRFTYNSEWFKPVFENSRILIFKVM